MKTVLHKSSSRGQANHGWLKSYHTFSFANYHNQERQHFGALRVLNDDTVAAGQGFGTHPHENMEIISIPLSGDLLHKDSLGNETVIKSGDVQAMSAGTGVLHSEYNLNTDQEVKFLQIWIIPNKLNVKPRYDQISLNEIAEHNKLYQILSPNPDDQGVWIHQNAWFHIGDFDADQSGDYEIKKTGNRIYVFVLEGKIEINETLLKRRDGYGMSDLKKFQFSTLTKARMLVMEVPKV